MAGELFLLPVWLGDAGTPAAMPAHNVALVDRVKLYFCEHEKTARQMLRRYSPTIDLSALRLHRLDKDTSESELNSYVVLLREEDAAIISEAGMPCIADPGARLVAKAHEHGIAVVPMTGPTSLMLALAASGLNGQRFSFHGYLPREPAQRKLAIKALEGEAKRTGGAQLFIETPYRNDAMFADIIASCDDRMRLCVAVDLDQPGGSVVTKRIAQWRSSPATIGKRPCVFIIG